MSQIWRKFGGRVSDWREENRRRNVKEILHLARFANVVGILREISKLSPSKSAPSPDLIRSATQSSPGRHLPGSYG